MSNEMISVPRHKLEAMAFGRMEFDEFSQYMNELQALLGQTATQHQGSAVTARVCAYTPGMGQVELKLPGNLPSWLELGEVVTVLHGNAQPQGGPVAWQRKSKNEDNRWFDLPAADVEEAQRLGYEVRPLYTHPAEQSAPVSVASDKQVVPVRRDWLEEWAMELVLAAQDGGTMSNQVEHLLQLHPKQ
ncbi:hypothetical protein [Pseudomonas protegens]|uniref:hypothetical protein n=1 Tax=Pseudomonas protegens TaxID=380021 RepID=UPI003814ABE8